MKRVLVLGNGFDRDFGSDTTYKTYAYTHFSKIQYVSPLFHELKARFDSLDDKNWFDFELEIAHYLKKWSSQTISSDVIQADEQYFKELLSMCRYMDIVGWKTPYSQREGYVNKNIQSEPFLFKNNVLLTERKQSVAYRILLLIAQYPDFFSDIITFNYTPLPDYLGIAVDQQYSSDSDTIRRVMAALSPKLKPIHITGPESQRKGVLGVSSTTPIPQGYEFLRKSNQVSKQDFEFVRDAIYDANQLIIFGHSLGESDFDYFSPLFKDMFSLEPHHDREVTIITYNNNRTLLENIQKMVGRKSIQMSKNFVKIKFIYTDYIESNWNWTSFINNFH